MSDETYQMIVDLLNQASIDGKDSVRVQHLRHVQELILRKDQKLLNEFFEDVLNFQTDKSIEVKKTVILFIEEVCKYDPKSIAKTIDSLHLLFNDENIFVQRRLILSMISIYQSILSWLLQSQYIDEHMLSLWQRMNDLNDQIVSKLTSDDDRLSTVIIKFVETLALALSRHRDKLTVSLQPHGSKTLARTTLEQENMLTNKLMDFILSPQTSSGNRIPAVETLVNIARQNLQFIPSVVQMFKSLNESLSSALVDDPSSNLRNTIRIKLLALLKCSLPHNDQSQIIDLLKNLGVAQEDINKQLPRSGQESKRKASVTYNPHTKRFKTTNTGINNGSPGKHMSPRSNLLSYSQPNDFMKVTTEDLVKKLTIENVVDLVIQSMGSLPDTMPESFQTVYQPVQEAGSFRQIEHLARLIHSLLVNTNHEPQQHHPLQVDKDVESENMVQYKNSGVEHYTSFRRNSSILKVKRPLKSINEVSTTVVEPAKPLNIKKFKSSKILNVNKTFEYDQLQHLSSDSFNRILHSEDACENIGAEHIRRRLLTSLTCLFEGTIAKFYEDYILSDIDRRYDLALAWLYQLYAYANGYVVSLKSDRNQDFEQYDSILCRFLKRLLDQNDEVFSRILSNAPLITDNSLVVLKQYCQDENHCCTGMNILRYFISHRAGIRQKSLDLLLRFTHSGNQSVRNNALDMMKALYRKPNLKPIIEGYALKCLTYLQVSHPPTTLFCDDQQLTAISKDVWTEDSVHLCLSVYLHLLPSNNKLIQPLVTVYPSVDKDIKRMILQVLEIPLREMDINSPEVVALVKSSPHGTETLIARIVHVLTRKTPPTREIVEKIRDLYHTRISDVRLLIPILTGLEKSEIINALPKFLKLSPLVVKEVFSRLLGLTGSSKSPQTTVLSPSELLIALHKISLDDCEMKALINATSICFNERSICTAEVLTVVLQHLVDLNPIPILFMRTVLQTLSLYPNMIEFIMKILQQLIKKQVWRQTRVWEGFIKFCEKARPHSFPILIQLPSVQLASILTMIPDLRADLLHYIRSMSTTQRNAIPSSVLIVIDNQSENEVATNSSA